MLVYNTINNNNNLNFIDPTLENDCVNSRSAAAALLNETTFNTFDNVTTFFFETIKKVLFHHSDKQ